MPPPGWKIYPSFLLGPQPGEGGTNSFLRQCWGHCCALGHANDLHLSQGRG